MLVKQTGELGPVATSTKSKPGKEEHSVRHQPGFKMGTTCNGN